VLLFLPVVAAVCQPDAYMMALAARVWPTTAVRVTLALRFRMKAWQGHGFIHTSQMPLCCCCRCCYLAGLVVGSCCLCWSCAQQWGLGRTRVMRLSWLTPGSCGQHTVLSVSC